MRWRLPAPTRSWLLASRRPYATSTRAADSLKILFCGSDDFSIISLRALDAARRRLPGLIDEIHVAHRPAKPTGRGLKTLRPVPITQAARDLSLPTHTLDTFTGWTPPFSYNLVVAVSFGLLVPPRILSLAPYGGLNVHPSLLPDLRGAAPIEHAILKRREYTGVSVQTLHPTHFDQGVVLAQTPPPGISIAKHETAAELEGRLAAAGADMLVDVLHTRKFVSPLQGVGWYAQSNRPLDHAPKITKQHGFIDFTAMHMDQILAVHRALGDTWCTLPNGDRLVMHELVTLPYTNTHGQPGLWAQHHGPDPLFRAACGRVGRIESSTYAGGKAGRGNAKVKKLLLNPCRVQLM
ncbi:Methionyl-tRNA formyltransferase [Ascochyta rabiei]|uniref:Hydroxymethyl-, formyl-and related transferase n=1 Tax=Didymella rabiei TaxID=5454 RepID=A0A162ZM52_DIDRA|nr:Methionyl-tRNA formyltransferase [Ascochyta rabiei]KZM20690.1 hydroxymethyl-, formyl- and related transferase [Ascochyta rabiei]UPX16844.1 Methionyl-tRNA formyltransferase [Ascochyta rabiei]